MKILVTGGTTFASRYTAEYFAKRGDKVYVLNRGNAEQSEGVTHIMCDRHALRNKLKRYAFDAVLDVTAYNGRDVREIANALGEYGTYILVSSSAVYPETLPQPFAERQKTGANSIWGKYGTDKIEAENAAAELFDDYYIVRPPYLYGEMNNLYREAFVFECAEQGRTFCVPKDGKMQLQFFHIDDMCQLIESLLMMRPKEIVFNIGDPETVSVEEWVRLCYEVVGAEPKLKYISGDIPQRSYFPFYDYEYVLDVSRQRTVMPWHISLKDGLKRSYEWFRENRDAVRRKPLMEFIDENGLLDT